MELRRIYLDTNVLVEAIEDVNAPAAKLMRFAAAGHFCVVQSDYVSTRSITWWVTSTELG